MAVLICFVWFFFLLKTEEEGMGKLNLLQIYLSVGGGGKQERRKNHCR